MKLTTLIILALASVCYSQEIPVTFNVDMNGTGLPAKDSVLNVSLRGSLEPLNWSSGIKMTDDNRDGIYSATVIFGGKENKELIFKYVVNSYEWEAGENMTLQIAKSQMPYNSKFRYVARPGNPFRKFIGEWTLKEDNWSQGYGKDIEHLKIPNHHTVCKEVNTDNSLLWVVDSPSSKGHIFWTYNHDKKEVRWLSSFYSFRSGVGQGSVNANGDVTFKVSFEGEPAGTYGLYVYKWISPDEYEMTSIQYNDKGERTGGFYGGTFIRVNPQKKLGL